MNEVIFTTSDNVEMKMGDYYYYYMHGSDKLRGVKICSWQDHTPAKGFIQFASKEAAQQFKTSTTHVD